MNKTLLIQSIVETLTEHFESTLQSSKSTRASSSDPESKAENKYDTRATEENYLADGLARQAQESALAAKAIGKLKPTPFGPDDPIDLGALIQLEFLGETAWFFLAPTGGGTEVALEGHSITVITPESPLGSQLMDLKAGEKTKSPQAMILSVE